jgi:hypothetical protein
MTLVSTFSSVMAVFHPLATPYTQRAIFLDKPRCASNYHMLQHERNWIMTFINFEFECGQDIVKTIIVLTM